MTTTTTTKMNTNSTSGTYTSPPVPSSTSPAYGNLLYSATCKTCKTHLPGENTIKGFYLSRGKGKGYDTWCRACGMQNPNWTAYPSPYDYKLQLAKQYAASNTSNVVDHPATFSRLIDQLMRYNIVNFTDPSQRYEQLKIAYNTILTEAKKLRASAAPTFTAPSSPAIEEDSFFLDPSDYETPTKK